MLHTAPVSSLCRLEPPRRHRAGESEGEHLSKALSSISVKADALPPWGEHPAPQTSSRDLSSWTEQQRQELGPSPLANCATQEPTSWGPRQCQERQTGPEGPKAPRGRPGTAVSAASLFQGRWMAPGLDEVGCGCWGSLRSLASHCSSHQAAVRPHTNPMRQERCSEMYFLKEN